MGQSWPLLVRGISLNLTASAITILRSRTWLSFTGTPPFDAAFTAGDLNFFPVDEGIGNLTPGFMEIFPYGTPGYPDDSPCLLLLQPVQVDQF